MFRLLLPMMAGILLYFFIPETGGYMLPSALILFAILLCVTLIPALQPRFGKEWKAGLVLSLLMVSLGCTVTGTFDYRNSDSFFSNHYSKGDLIALRIDEPVSVKENTVRVFAKLEYCGKENAWKEISGRMLLWMEKDDASEALHYGDLILLETNPVSLAPPANPHEFDYRRYLSYRNVFHQAYVKKNHWQLLSQGNGNPVYSFALSMRERLLQTYRDAGISGDEFAVIAALTAGYTDEIDPDLRKAYADSGTLHVLSVSGLHVGIIFAVINFFLFFLDRKKHGLIIKAVIIILFLWFYAFMTGLSPPVLRAALMLSFVVAGKALNRQTGMINTILASAFLILLVNPFALADVGFQLTYLAVIGIVILQKPIYEAFSFKRKIPDQIWKLTAVSLAAQIATFPISLFYFHQFPNFFLISNLIIIPISTVSIYAAIAALVFSGIPWLAEASAWLLDFVVWLMNQAVLLFDNLPFATLTGIQSGVAETLLLYGMITGFLIFILQNSVAALRATLVLACLMLCISLFRENRRQQQQVFTVYHAGKATAVQFVQGRNATMVFEGRKNSTFQKIRQRLGNDWTWLGTGMPDTLSLNRVKQGEFNNNYLCNRDASFLFAGKRFTLVSDAIGKETALKKLRTDFLIITGSPKLSVARLKKLYDFSMLIIDAANSDYRCKRWIAECEALGVRYYSVKKDGAFEMKF